VAILRCSKTRYASGHRINERLRSSMVLLHRRIPAAASVWARISPLKRTFNRRLLPHPGGAGYGYLADPRPLEFAIALLSSMPFAFSAQKEKKKQM